MVDMLMILTVFLLMTFSASGELLSVQKNIVFPGAGTAISSRRRSSPCRRTRSRSTAHGGRRDRAQPDNTADWKIVELHDEMVTLKNNYKLLHPSDEWKGMVIVQADKGVDFKVVKKVMYSCAMAGYQNVNFAVQQKSKGGG